MVAVLDAQALEAFLRDEPAALRVEQILTSGEHVLMAATNLAETFDRLKRVHRAETATLVADMFETGVHFSTVDLDLAVEAAELRAAHYHRVHRAVSLSDCTAAALALDRGARLATSDPALLELVVAEGGDVEPLPGSNGSVWIRR